MNGLTRGFALRTDAFRATEIGFTTVLTERWWNSMAADLKAKIEPAYIKGAADAKALLQRN